MKYKHIGVFLRGQLRTWNFCKTNIFAVYESIAENVDYYFSTWDVSYVDKSTLLNDFLGKSLIGHEFLTQPEKFDSDPSFYAPAMQTYSLLPAKWKREKEVTYDACFDQRFDVINWIVYDPYLPEPMEIYTPQPPFKHKVPIFSRNENDFKVDNFVDAEGLADIGFMSDSRTFDIISCRFLRKSEDKSPELKLRDFCLDAGIEMPGMMPFGHCIIRPHITDLFLDPVTILTNEQIDKIINNIFEWQNKTIEDKIKDCLKNNINLNEFLFNIKHFGLDANNSFEEIKNLYDKHNIGNITFHDKTSE